MKRRTAAPVSVGAALILLSVILFLSMRRPEPAGERTSPAPVPLASEATGSKSWGEASRRSRSRPGRRKRSWCRSRAGGPSGDA